MDLNALSYREKIADLPVTPFLERICASLASSPQRSLILTAQTAAGKSTAVPPALLERFPGKILMLEPRRLAALAIARRVAELLGEEPGQTAGYRMRLESRVSARTRLEVMTEAVLTRRLQSDPLLEGVSVVILDEFHERSVHADLALAFLKEAMPLRDDLYILVMSATIDTRPVAEYLGTPENPAPALELPGRQFPVEISYAGDIDPAEAVLSELERRRRRRHCGNPSEWQDGASARVRSGNGSDGARPAASPHGKAQTGRPSGDKTAGGSILVFLPGISEIRKCRQRLEAAGVASDSAEVMILHSSVGFAEQKKVLSPPPSGVTRVILSSSVAETSLTVPDVTTVIDSGLARVNRMNTAAGMERLVTEPESEFSARQRAGRAGRLMPGRCIRLWAESDPRVRRAAPEILRTDLTPLVLECAQWGVSDAAKLSWLDRPSDSAWSAAVRLLEQIGCMADGKITATGKAALAAGIHPRLACIALSGAVEKAVAYSEFARADPALQKRFRADLERRIAGTAFRRAGGNAERADEAGFRTDAAPPQSGSAALLAGFPDRIARLTERGGVYQFPSGRKARILSEPRGGAFPLWIVAPEADAGEREGVIYSYEPLDDDFASEWLSVRAEKKTQAAFVKNRKTGVSAVRKTELTCYGHLVLAERRLPVSPDDYAAALCGEVRSEGLAALPLSDNAERLLVRARFYEQQRGLPSAERRADGSALAAAAETWLLPFVAGRTEVGAETVYQALYQYLDGAALERAVPEQLVLPNGKRRRLSYETQSLPDDKTKTAIRPVLEIIIQQIFGCFETPRVMGMPVLLRLLSPARRPLQITDDLANFWANTWPQICREMRGRYPRHNWDYRKSE